jgi:hypothetical protein
MGCLAKYGKLETVLCCSLSWRGEERALVSHVVEIVNFNFNNMEKYSMFS